MLACIPFPSFPSLTILTTTISPPHSSLFRRQNTFLLHIYILAPSFPLTYYPLHYLHPRSKSLHYSIPTTYKRCISVPCSITFSLIAPRLPLSLLPSMSPYHHLGRSYNTCTKYICSTSYITFPSLLLSLHTQYIQELHKEKLLKFTRPSVYSIAHRPLTQSRSIS